MSSDENHEQALPKIMLNIDVGEWEIWIENAFPWRNNQAYQIRNNIRISPHIGLTTNFLVVTAQLNVFDVCVCCCFFFLFCVWRERLHTTHSYIDTEIVKRHWHRFISSESQTLSAESIKIIELEVRSKKKKNSHWWVQRPMFILWGWFAIFSMALLAKDAQI